VHTFRKAYPQPALPILALPSVRSEILLDFAVLSSKMAQPWVLAEKIESPVPMQHIA
jgi:hypothetical protein